MARIAAALEIRHEPLGRPRAGALNGEENGSPSRARGHSYRDSMHSPGSDTSSPDRDQAETDTDNVNLSLGTHNKRPRSVSGSFVEDGDGNPYYYGGTSFLAISNEAADGAHQAAAKSPSPANATIQAADLNEIQDKVAGLLDPNPYVTLAQAPQGTKHNKFWIPPREQSLEIITDYFRSFAWIFPLFSKEKFMRRVEAMYTNLDAEVDVGWLICFLNVIVCGVYGECNNKDELTREYLEGTERMKILQKATKVIWDCIDDTSTLLKPRLLNVQALLMMAS